LIYNGESWDILDNTQFVTGTYTGNGNSYQDIQLGFKPKAVLVTNRIGQMGDNTNGGAKYTYIFGGLALADYPLYGSTITITNNGFRAYYSSSGTSNLSAANGTDTYSNPYRYIAFK
jgi:hypothetical protein